MLTKNQIKYINKLKQKKYRLQEGVFVAEGLKIIKELIHANVKLQQIFATEALLFCKDSETIITANELDKISFLKTPNKALAIFKIPALQPVDFSNIIVALDNVRDPGNLGTIIRLCDWFGVTHLVCNLATVDCYNPKVIQATMGSIARVQVSYVNLETFLNNAPVPIFGTFMEGENIYKLNLPKSGIVVLGNEANGISKSIMKLVSKKISIPRFGKLQETESLNVATAGAIVLSEFKRAFTGK